MTHSRELDGKVAIVTGGSRGIGRGIVRELARAGCSVVFTYQNRDDAALDLTRELEGENVLAVKADAREADAAKTVFERTKDSFSGLHILVNNAGVTRDRSLSLMQESEWQEVIDTNLTACYRYAKIAAPLLMRQMGGRIVNITSISGIRGLPGQTNYSASKAGMIGFTKSLARELGPFNVTVNAVAPGYIETEMLDHLPANHKTQMRKTTPMQRFGQTSDVANVVRFLASDAAGYVTGQVIGVDGGLGI